MDAVRRCLVVVVVVASLTVSGAAVAVAELDADSYSACQVVADADRTPSKRVTKQLARQFKQLDAKRARKKLADAFADADSKRARRRALTAAYAWCDGTQDAYRVVPIALTSPSQVELVDADTTVITGTTAPGATIRATLTAGLSPPVELTAQADPTGAFSLPVTGAPMGSSTVRLSATAELYSPATFPSPVTIVRNESEGAFKASAAEIPADELVKDPAALRGRRIYGRGEVFQYDSRTGLTSMLVSVTVVNPGRYEFWKDNTLLRLPDAALGNGVDNDDIIEFWGEVEGPYTYDTAIGGSNTVPAVVVRYLNLVEKR